MKTKTIRKRRERQEDSGWLKESGHNSFIPQLPKSSDQRSKFFFPRRADLGGLAAKPCPGTSQEKAISRATSMAAEEKSLAKEVSRR